MKKLIITILTVFAALPFVSAQEVPDYGCTPSHKKPLFSVQCFLTDDDESSKADRIKSGTEGIPINEIRPVDDIKVCSRLDSLLDANPNFLKIKKTATATKYFYQTNNFYFITWRKPNTLGGVKAIFIVINSKFEVAGVFYV